VLFQASPGACNPFLVFLNGFTHFKSSEICIRFIGVSQKPFDALANTLKSIPFIDTSGEVSNIVYKNCLALLRGKSCG
jgi:hypothetical protein